MVFKSLIDILGHFGALVGMVSLSQHYIIDTFLKFDVNGMDYYYNIFIELLK